MVIIYTIKKETWFTCLLKHHTHSSILLSTSFITCSAFLLHFVYSTTKYKLVYLLFKLKTYCLLLIIIYYLHITALVPIYLHTHTHTHLYLSLYFFFLSLALIFFSRSLHNFFSIALFNLSKSSPYNLLNISLSSLRNFLKHTFTLFHSLT